MLCLDSMLLVLFWVWWALAAKMISYWIKITLVCVQLEDNSFLWNFRIMSALTDDIVHLKVLQMLDKEKEKERKHILPFKYLKWLIEDGIVQKQYWRH